MVEGNHLCKTRQINQSKTQNVGRVNLQVDGLPVDALIASGNPRRLVLNLPLDLAEVVEPAAGNVSKLGPFILTGYTRWRVWHVYLGLVVSAARDVDELQNQRSPCDNAASTRQKVSPDNVLEYR